MTCECQDGDTWIEAEVVMDEGEPIIEDFLAIVSIFGVDVDISETVMSNTVAMDKIEEKLLKDYYSKCDDSDLTDMY